MDGQPMEYFSIEPAVIGNGGQSFLPVQASSRSPLSTLFPARSVGRLVARQELLSLAQDHRRGTDVDTDSLHDFVRGVRQGENIPSPDCSHLPVGYAKMNEKEARHEAPRVMAE